MKTYLFLGDSITDCNHYFDPDGLGFGYVRKIAEALEASGHPCQIINKGNDGFTASSVSRLWKNFCRELSPDFITILIGINDLSVILENHLTLSAALSDFYERYAALLDEIRQRISCPILLMEPFIFPYPAEYSTWEPPLKEMRKRIQQLAQDRNAAFLPLSDLLVEAAKTQGYPAITTDGIHLTDAGHQLIARQWIKHSQLLLPR